MGKLQQDIPNEMYTEFLVLVAKAVYEIYTTAITKREGVG